MTEGERARYDRLVFALAQVFGAIGDEPVRVALVDSLLQRRLYPETVAAVRDWLTEALVQAGHEDED